MELNGVANAIGGLDRRKGEGKAFSADAAAAPVELPAVLDSGRWVAAPELSTYIGELGHTVALWRKFQSDACYIDDDGSVC